MANRNIPSELFNQLGSSADLIIELIENGLGVENVQTWQTIQPYPDADPRDLALARKIMTIHYALIREVNGQELPVPVLLIMTLSRQHAGYKWDSVSAQGFTTYNQGLIRERVESEIGYPVVVVDYINTAEWLVTAYDGNIAAANAEIPNHAIVIIRVNPEADPGVPVNRPEGCELSNMALYQQHSVRVLLHASKAHGVDSEQQGAALIVTFIIDDCLGEEIDP